MVMTSGLLFGRLITTPHPLELGSLENGGMLYIFSDPASRPVRIHMYDHCAYPLLVLSFVNWVQQSIGTEPVASFGWSYTDLWNFLTSVIAQGLRTLNIELLFALINRYNQS